MFSFRKIPKVDLSVYEKWVGEANRRTDFTPDISELEQHEYQLLFVYGETQRGHPAFPIVNEGSAHICTAFTNTPGFTLWKRNRGLASTVVALSAPLPEKDAAPLFPPTHFGVLTPSSRIKGELYAIRPYQMMELDKYHLNGYHYLRRRVHLAIPYSQVMWLKHPYLNPTTVYSSTYKTDTKIRIVKAWMYLGIPEYWEPQLDGGYEFTPVKLMRTYERPWISNYYYFTKNEYDVESNSS